MPISRNAAQEKAMILIYDILTYESINLSYDIKDVISSFMEEPFEEVDLYVREVVVKAILHKDEIVSSIEPALTDWHFERLNRLAQSILLLAVSHYKYVKDVDKAIVINVAVTLAKRYLDEKDYKFINGVLDKILCK